MALPETKDNSEENYEAKKNKRRKRKFFAYREILMTQYSSQLANTKPFMLLLL